LEVHIKNHKPFYFCYYYHDYYKITGWFFFKLSSLNVYNDHKWNNVFDYLSWIKQDTTQDIFQYIVVDSIFKSFINFHKDVINSSGPIQIIAKKIGTKEFLKMQGFVSTIRPKQNVVVPVA
jgi:hypothetical protein